MTADDLNEGYCVTTMVSVDAEVKKVCMIELEILQEAPVRITPGHYVIAIPFNHTRH